jgi:Family of unknown function (DUF5681)
MASDDEKVGYKRPPRRTQFKPGQSGNPTGKNSGTRNIATELQDILSEQITFAADGALKTMSKQRALASALVSAAIGGDLRATAIVMSHLSRDAQRTPDEESESEANDFSAVHAHRKRKAKLR